jgi:NADPH:quinone reductase-like Zn-dependent oxidoreductase
MKAILYNKKATPNKLVYSDAEQPGPKEHELLIKVCAASPNAADYRAMKMGMIPKHKIFGSAIAGIVESVGSKVKQFKAGDEVLADLADFGFGGFAEYALASEKIVAHKPKELSFDEAATLPVAATTALRACYKADIQSGQQVLILGSGGGVGSFAVQLAKYFGAEVTALCSARNMEQTRTLGADVVLDYTKEKLDHHSARYDVILGVNGNYPLLQCKRLLKPRGKYVLVGGALSLFFKSLLFGRLLSLGSKKMRTLAAKSNKEDIAFVAQLLAEGKIRTRIENRYELSQTAEAMQYISGGHAQGKQIISLL